MARVCRSCCGKPITVHGCNSKPLAGATVSVALNPSGVVVASGTTDGSGQFSFSPSSGVAYKITTSKTRFNTNTTTYTGGAALPTITLSPATGFTCPGGTTCADPWANTLHGTTPAGAVTATFVSGLGWVGTISVPTTVVFNPSLFTCTAASGTAPISISFNAGSGMMGYALCCASSTHADFSSEAGSSSPSVTLVVSQCLPPIVSLTFPATIATSCVTPGPTINVANPLGGTSTFTE